MITTFTCKTVNPFELSFDDIDIRDIAHALACINRFNGHAIKPISVAQHSVYVSRVVENANPRLNKADRSQVLLQALLHDASEAYIGDVTKWIKQTEVFKMYRELEYIIQETIFEAFNIFPFAKTRKMVSYADKLMVRYEAFKSYGKDYNFGGYRSVYPPLAKEEKALIGKWSYWSWKTAEEVFLAEFRTLKGWR